MKSSQREVASGCDGVILSSTAGEEEEGEGEEGAQEVVREFKCANCPKVHEKVKLNKAECDKPTETFFIAVAFTANN